MKTDAQRLARYDAIVEGRIAWRFSRVEHRVWDHDAMDAARAAVHKAGAQIIDDQVLRLLTYVYQDGQR